MKVSYDKLWKILIDKKNEKISAERTGTYQQ